MAKRIALAFLALAAPLILASFLSESEAALWLFSFLAMAFPIALIVAAVEHPTKLRSVADPPGTRRGARAQRYRHARLLARRYHGDAL